MRKKVYIVIGDTKLSKIKLINLKRYIIENSESEIVILLISKEINDGFRNMFPDVEMITLDIFIHYSSHEYVMIAENEIKNFSENFEDNEYMFPKLYTNTIYSNAFAPLINLKNNLKIIIEKENVTELVLIDGNKDVEYFSIFNSEMERSLELFYRRSWFVNYYINKWFAKDCHIVWLNKRSKLFLKMNLFLRRKAFPMVRKIKLNLKLNLYLLRGKRVKSNLKNTYLICLRSNSQYIPSTNLKKTLEDYGKNVFYVALNYKIFKYLSSINVKCLFIFDWYSVKKARAYRRALFNLKKNSKKIKGNTEYLGVNYNHLKDELFSEYSNDLFTVQLFDDLLKSNSKQVEHLFSFETFSIRAAMDGYLSIKNNIKSSTIQHVTYIEEIRPIPIWSQNIFFMTKNISEYYKIQFPQYKDYFHYLGPCSFDSVFNISNHMKSKVITVFTQPDDFFNDYYMMIDGLTKLLELSNWELRIKPHPRDKNYNEYEKLINKSNNIQIYDKYSNSTEIIQDSALIISIFSSTLFQALIIGTPMISINYNGNYNDMYSKIDYLCGNKDLIFRSLEDVKTILNNFEQFREKYQRLRLKYFLENFMGYNGNATSEILKYLGIEEDLNL